MALIAQCLIIREFDVDLSAMGHPDESFTARAETIFFGDRSDGVFASFEVLQEIIKSFEWLLAMLAALVLVPLVLVQPIQVFGLLLTDWTSEVGALLPSETVVLAEGVAAGEGIITKFADDHLVVVAPMVIESELQLEGLVAGGLGTDELFGGGRFALANLLLLLAEARTVLLFGDVEYVFVILELDVGRESVGTLIAFRFDVHYPMELIFIILMVPNGR